MSVQFIIDDFDLAQGSDIKLTDPAAIPQLRVQIKENLAFSQETPLSIALSSVLFKRLQDLEGAQGIAVTRISPFTHLRALLGDMPPLWLTEDLAEQLELGRQ